ncbi:MAG: hypothetical protein M3N49_15175 [Candidatus Eremiobacteraeota bacterium]|nr:hypothetical protein [Candidatus Eremiobacteraeota bacterium]
MPPFTAHSDLFVAIHEDGLNLIAQNVMKQRPSMFNYASAAIAAQKNLWCAPVDVTPDVTAHGNPIFTVEQPLPVLGTIAPAASLDWSAQVLGIRLDVHPGNVVTLPAELHPPLKQQRFAFAVDVAGQIACPDAEALSAAEPKGQQDRLEPVVLSPGRKPNCFKLEAIAIGRVDVKTVNGTDAVVTTIDDVDIVGLGGEPFEDAISCYVRTTLNLVLFQRLRIALSTFLLHVNLMGGTISLALAPVPHNPALQEDRIELFVNLEFM